MSLTIRLLALFLIDLVAKQAAYHFLRPEGSRALFGDFFRLTYVENTGAAFGRFAGYNHWLALFSIGMIFLLAVFLGRAETRMERRGFLLIMAGAIGNTVDRLARGHVIDFLDFDFFDLSLPSLGGSASWHLERWPVFNFADSYIFIGTGMVIAGILLPARKKRETSSSHKGLPEHASRSD